jgi:predicted phage baseplate assembly protein
MPLPSPLVDERTYADLIGEAEAVIHRLAPAWTNHNASDPGRTLLELLAWITEADLYRTSRAAASSLRAFLRWLGVTPHPAGVAETWIEVVQPFPPDGQPFDLAAGTEVKTAEKDGVIFSTTAPVRIVPASLTAQGAVLVDEGGALVDRTDDNEDARPFAPLGARPATNDALYLGFDQPLAGLVQLYVRTTTAADDDATRARLVAESNAHAADLCAAHLEGTSDWRTHYGVDTVWEYWTGATGWQAIPTVVDETRALTLSGVVRLDVPAGHAAGWSERSGCFIRYRLLRGTYDCPPSIVRVGINAVPVRHARRVAGELLGVSTGRADQFFPCKNTPIVFEDADVHVDVAGATEGWNVASDWDRVGAHARTCVLDSTDGGLRFGNGRRGRVPPAEAMIHFDYCVGSGPAGNLRAGSLRRASLPDGTPIGVRQRFDATGGTLAETIDEARGRAIRILGETRRAVTLADFETLALETPGVPVGRALAIADHHPDLPGYPALGSVTVVIVPACMDGGGVASGAMLDAVACYLDRRRTITTELHVVAARFVTVAVRARLYVAAGADPRAIQQTARARINDFFHPLQGGPDGGGWPIGRAVYRSEIFALLTALPQVTDVDELSLLVDDESGGRCGNVPICVDTLVAPGVHDFTVVPRRSQS